MIFTASVQNILDITMYYTFIMHMRIQVRNFTPNHYLGSGDPNAVVALMARFLTRGNDICIARTQCKAFNTTNSNSTNHDQLMVRIIFGCSGEH
jgi:hypothetical protein